MVIGKMFWRVLSPLFCLFLFLVSLILFTRTYFTHTIVVVCRTNITSIWYRKRNKLKEYSIPIFSCSFYWLLFICLISIHRLKSQFLLISLRPINDLKYMKESFVMSGIFFSDVSFCGVNSCTKHVKYMLSTNQR